MDVSMNDKMMVSVKQTLSALTPIKVWGEISPNRVKSRVMREPIQFLHRDMTL